MKTAPEKFRFRIILFLTLIIIEGLAALGVFLSYRSMEKNALLFGYSPFRLVLAISFSILLALLTWTLLRSINNRAWLTGLLERIDRQVRTNDRLLSAAMILVSSAIIGTAAIAAARVPLTFNSVLLLEKISPQAPGWFEFLQTVLRGVEPLIAWLALAALQTLLFLLVNFPEYFREKWVDGAILKAVSIVSILALTGWHWLILLVQLNTLQQIPGWKWYFEIKPYQPSHWWFAGLFAAAILGSLLAWKVRRRVWLSLIILAAVGTGLQIGMGFVEGGGFESLRLIYSTSVFNNYAEAAARRPDFLEALVNYEQLYGEDWYLGTKPPGVILVYNLVQRSIDLFQPLGQYADRFYQLTSVIAHFFPLISMLVLVPLYWFNRTIFNIKEDALLPGMLLVFTPTMVLIPLFLDQVLYPLIFMGVLLIVQRSINKASTWLAFLAGLAGYLAIYFSFSLAVLLPLSALWILLHPVIINTNKRWNWKATLKMLAGYGAGLLVGFLLLRLLLNYDILVRFTAAMQQHRIAKNYEPGFEQIMNALLLNNAEFITWNGFPLILPALFAIGQSIRRLMLRQPQSLDGLTIPFLVTYVMLNFMGQTNGEVQRLWLFMVPLVCIYAASYAASLFKRKLSGIVLIIAIQLISVFLLFKFQNFYG